MARKRWGRALGLALATSGAFFAAALSPAARAADDPSYVSLAAGAFDVLHNRTRAGEFRGEYRFSQKLWIFKPFLGVLGTSDSAFYGYGGFLVDIYLTPHWVLMPNAAIGWFDRGDGKKLGARTEFRTGAEFAYRFDNAMRIGLSFNHISNAGLSRTNPGEEEAAIVFSLPVDFLK